jgi:hypothetical protein
LLFPSRWSLLHKAALPFADFAYAFPPRPEILQQISRT